MKKFPALLFLLVLLVVLATSFAVLAADAVGATSNTSGGSDGIVPCQGLDCDLCSVGKLAQNIINFLLAISIPIAAVMFAYAGVLYVTSSGNPSKVAKAHKVFKNVGIGFALAISGWLVVQTILSTLFNDSFWVGGNWNELKCVEDSRRLMDKDLSDLFNEVFGEVNVDPIFIEPGEVSTGCTPSGSDCIQLHSARFSYKAGRIVTREYAFKLEQFGTALDSNIAITITEACPVPQGVHQNPCHNACTCTDIVTTDRSLMTNAEYLNAVHNAAKAAGMCAVFESRSARPAGYTGPFYQGNYENHFSLYMDSSQSPTCGTGL